MSSGPSIVFTFCVGIMVPLIALIALVALHDDKAPEAPPPAPTLQMTSSPKATVAGYYRSHEESRPITVQVIEVDGQRYLLVHHYAGVSVCPVPPKPQTSGDNS